MRSNFWLQSSVYQCEYCFAVIVVMLGGGDKSTQQADIGRAKALALTIED